MSELRLAILDSDSGFVRVLVKRAGDLGWQYRRLEAAAPHGGVRRHARERAGRSTSRLLGPGALGVPGAGVGGAARARASWSARVARRVSQRVRGLRLGADDWVTKPCHPEEVLARVEAVVRRRKRASARVDTGPLVAGELEIRADQFQAFVARTSVDLTRREFEVLQLLAQAKGKVLQREEIYQAVWGYAMAHGDRSVDVFIRKVRQKLEKASPDWNYIHTHFGVGYRFEPERRVDEDIDPPLVPEAPDLAERPVAAESSLARSKPRSAQSDPAPPTRLPYFAAAMSSNQRIGLIVAALAVAVVAFVVARPGDDEPESSATTTRCRPRPRRTPGTHGLAEPQPTETGPPAPPVTRMRSPVVWSSAAPRRSRSTKGDTVRIVVTARRRRRDPPARLRHRAHGGARAARALPLHCEPEGEFEMESHVAEDAGKDPLVARLVVAPA